MRYSVLILIFLGAMACNGKRKLPPALFKLLSPQETGLDFVNQVVPNDSLNILFFNYFYNGGGVAIGDVNNDGLPDIYLAGNMVSSRLYLNQGNLRFEDITMPAGVGTAGHWATGVTMIDLNHDGLQDIYVCLSAHPDPALRANKLFINQGIDQGGRPVFQEMATQCGLADSGYSTQAAFFDYDRDGDLDVYLLSVGQDSLNPNIPRPKKMNGSAPSTDRLFRNNDDGTGGRLSFTNVSKPAGIVAEGFGLGVAISDFDLDGWPDIFVANDFIYNDLLYLNNRNGTFTEAAQRGFKHQSRFSMGTDAADFNNDTLTDLAVLDMWPPDNQRQKLMNMGMNYDLFLLALDRGYIPQYVRNMLHLNNGNGTFSEIGQLAGIDKTDWSWSALWADYDNDGFKDLFVTNGIPKDITDSDFVLYRDANAGEAADTKVFTKKLLAMVEQLPAVRKHSYLFKNQGNFTFTDFSAQAGFSTPTCSNGAAYADLDNDGDVDLVVNNLGDPAFIYENTAAKTLKNKVLQIKLVGSKLNPDGIGAKVNVYTGPIIQQYAQWRTRGFQSSVGQVLNVGLGTAAQADSLEVIWPDGKKQVLRDVNPLRPIILDYRLAGAHWPQPVPRPTLFTQAAGFYGIAHRHEENPFIDFKQEPLLPHKLSQQSPALAVGDVNGDGLQDFCVGSAARRPAMLFTQSRLGKFTASELPDSLFEDGGMLLFDADQDGDNDLYVVSAGNEFNANTRPYQDRFYRNDGKGKFVIDEQALPPLMASGSCVIAADYDRDGDLDLFVGGSHVPGQYPLPASSYLLENQGGIFKDVTKEACPALGQVGMVKAALWTDFDNDLQVDLLVTGEWMGLRFFKNQNGKLVELAHTGLPPHNGWWNSLIGGDFDQDGDTDYVAGNLGTNSRYQASPQQPVSLYAKDFDQNGRLDFVLAHFLQGQAYPAHTRDALIDQLPMMRKRFPRYATYAKATLDQVLLSHEQAGAHLLQSQCFSSSYIENLGNHRFALRPLPIEAQFSPVQGILASDFDQDGRLDLLLVGNSHATEFVAGWYDAGIGLYLRGDGKGGFVPVTARQSGFLVDKDAKSLAEILDNKQRRLVLAGQNSDSVKVFSISTPPKKTHTILFAPSDAFLYLISPDGRKSKHECYHGAGYLSQSGAFLQVALDGPSRAEIYSSRGKLRVVIPLQIPRGK